MSSLQSIMNLDDDQQEPSSLDKKDKDQATPASGFRRQDPSSSTSSSQVTSSHPPYSSIPSAPTITIPVTEGSKLYYPSQQPFDVNPSSISSAHQSKRLAEPSSATPTLSAASSGPGDLRRQSSTSVDSMDQYGYASSSSMGGGSGGGYPPNHPRRPMGTSPSPDVPVRYTPITGRVSRAKKGVPVHICENCNPPKTFTRAEHLRRHQLSHQQPRFPCDRCDRAFHRQDLLTRHQQRHNQEGGDQASQGGDDSRRGSEASGASGPMTGSSQQPYHSASRAFDGTSTTSSMSADMPPGTPPHGSRAASTMSPPPRGGATDAYGPSPDPSNNYRFGMRPDGNMRSSPDPPTFTTVDYNMIPRTAPMPLFVSTQGLQVSATLHTSLDNPPDLIHTAEYSPWTSASESTYSTPNDRPSRRRHWRHAPQNSLGWQANSGFLASFPNAARQEISTSGGLDTMATTQYYVSNGFSVSPHMAPVPNHSYNPLLSGSMLPDFADEPSQALLDPSIGGHHAINQQRSSSVRSQTPEICTATSGQTADSLVTPAPLPPRINPVVQARQKDHVMEDGDQDGQMGLLGSGGDWYWNSNSNSPGDSGVLTGAGLKTGCGIGGVTMLTPLPRSVRNAIPSYIDIYWERLHAFYPVVHRQVFEEQGEEVLRCAMAALATQFSNGQEDRIRGSQLHDYAWQEAKRYPQWNLQVMQAILLCELFARFRGRKAVLRPSKLFEHLYSRVLDQGSDLYDRVLPSNAATFGHQIPMGMGLAKEDQWHTWIEAEGKRRVLAACFIIDNHAAMFHDSSRARGDVDYSTIPLNGHNDALWSATSADEWFAILHNSPTTGRVQFMPRLDSLTPEQVAQYSFCDRAVILNAAALSLSRRNSQRISAGKGDDQEPISADDLRTPTTASFTSQALQEMKPDDRLCHLFSLVNAITPNIYLALYHTPLHDLLAVSGESWVFSQKIIGSLTFNEHQKRLKAWIEGRSSTSPTSPNSPTAAGLEGMSSTKATIHAARALVGYFNCSVEASNGVTPYMTSVSNYWGMYVCALIIWAFGHKAGRSSSSGSSLSSPISTKSHHMNEDEAVAWLRVIADSGMPENLGRAKGRREASAVIVSMVKRRLEADCVGGRSRLYVDAVGVLKKLEEAVNRKWF